VDIIKSNLLVLQARIGSQRLPGKVMREILGKPLIKYQIDRMKKSKLLDDLVVAIPKGAHDDVLEDFLSSNSVTVYRGENYDVASRFKGAIDLYSAEVIVRSTADCPLFMPELLDKMLLFFQENELDYMSNAIKPSYPDGLDIEIFSRKAFNTLINLELTLQQREHVTLGFYDGSYDFKIFNFANDIDLSSERWTVDYIEDFNFIAKIFEKTNPFVTFNEVLVLLENHPELKNEKTSEFRNIQLKGIIINEKV
jgi:spore coat polysaccharide biosynthesis protein SpsF (cytidylyltransferase family)